jgi:hypothetical protein
MPQEMLRLLSESAFDVVLEQFPNYKYVFVPLSCFDLSILVAAVVVFFWRGGVAFI